MLRRTRQAQTALVFAAFELEVIHLRIGVGVVGVDTYALKSRSDETEVALQSHFHAQNVGIARIAWLGEFGVGNALILVVVESLVDNKVVDRLVENASAHQSNALEVLFGAEVDVVADGRSEVGVTEFNSIVATVDADVRSEVGVFGSSNCVRERSSKLEVVLNIPLHHNVRKNVDVVFRLVRGASYYIFIGIVLRTAVAHMSVLQAKTHYCVEVFAKFLVETEVSGSNCFASIIV